ncbi:hypothetical protein BB560_000067 [Smittium megazygosporum]|uniref:GPI ethanolamine phosphate transferase 1 n=1 Tax=Smittium megazygosporum TaxID=133381 RepID=A0A2T9ZLE0_9FUNG|nr:hypothetical protein BB560_000067 [Smittium megazygosporum]
MISTRNGLLAIGLAFHIVYLFSIFDIYFRSPLVHGMTPQKVNAPPPADRVILFVADGLRVDKLMEPYYNSTTMETTHLAPYLLNITRGHGSYGVSHTRVPTESRPGHVALIAGFYEDVSAVTKGWKTNPVDFDSVFNQSSHTWAFGSPDIIPMFSHGVTEKNKIESIMYSSESEDFTREAWHLDEFVFEKVKDMFKNAEHDFQLRSQLNQKGVVIFMHLLGLDTNGHAFRPYSQEYLRNIAYVDNIVKETVNMVEKFFNYDSRTAYIFSADHGMGDRGVHGDGNPDNTRTPLIAWGSGVAKSGLNSSSPSNGHDQFSENWGLKEYERKDVNQADIAPLMSSLAGIPFPMNSVGKVPLSYIDSDLSFKAQVMLTNAKQIFEQYEIKQSEKKKSRISFSPFEPLSSPNNFPLDRIANARHLMSMGNFQAVIDECSEAIDLGLLGLRYYQKYDWVLLRSVITFGYIGWIVFSLLFILRNYTDFKYHLLTPDPTPLLNQPLESDENQEQRVYEEWGAPQYLLAASILFFTFLLLRIQDAPLIYYAYFLFPLYFWLDSIRQLPSILNALKIFKFSSKKSTIILHVIGILISLETLVYAYHDRRVYTVIMILLAFSWIVTVPKKAAKKNFGLIASWAALCLMTSIFTLLPVEKGENISQCMLGGITVTAIGTAYFVSIKKILSSSDSAPKNPASVLNQAIAIQKTKTLIGILTSFNALATVLVYSTSKSLHNRQGLPPINQLLTWIIFVASIVFPIIYMRIYPEIGKDQYFMGRLVIIFLSFATPMIILTISYESLFFICFIGVLTLWLMLERVIYDSASDNLFLSNSLYPEDTNSKSSREQSDTSKSKQQFLITEPHSSWSSDAKEPASLNNKNSSLHSKDNSNVLYLQRSLKLSDMRIALMFLMLINLAFFGTGNVASLASFSLESVYRLVSVFNPFLMTILLLYKIFIPFFAVSSVFAIINLMLDLPPFCLFLLGLSTTDIMTLNFFYLVKDEGSWLDIGTTISHFCISSSFVLFSIVLFSISNALIRGVFIPKSRVKLGILKKSG